MVQVTAQMLVYTGETERAAGKLKDPPNMKFKDLYEVFIFELPDDEKEKCESRRKLWSPIFS